MLLVDILVLLEFLLPYLVMQQHPKLDLVCVLDKCAITLYNTFL